MGTTASPRPQEYIHALGFTDVNNGRRTTVTTGFTDDNSFYDPEIDRITFGTGGVDDAEDAEVIWHEYGHAIQDDQVPGFGSSPRRPARSARASATTGRSRCRQAISPNTATTPLACVADWDSTSYTNGTPHCLRRIDGTKVYPGDLDGEVHDDGEIWSRALLDINQRAGPHEANRIILESQFFFTPNITMPAGGEPDRDHRAGPATALARRTRSGPRSTPAASSSTASSARP